MVRIASIPIKVKIVLSRFWTVLLFSLFTLSSSPAAYSHDTQDPNTADFSQLAPNTQPANSQEISTLVRAATQLIQAEHHQIESIMQLTGNAPGVQFTSHLKIKTIVTARNQINSKITFFSPAGTSGKSYQVISDGKQVWIYDQTANQYSVSDYQEFIDSRDSFMIGMLTDLYLSMQPKKPDNSFSTLLAKISEENFNQFFIAQLGLDEQSIRTQQVAQQEKQYQAYLFNNSSQDFRFQILLHKPINTASHLTISGKSSGMDITLNEEIISQTSPLVLAPQTFKFQATDSARQTENTITIDPF